MTMQSWEFDTYADQWLDEFIADGASELADDVQQRWLYFQVWCFPPGGPWQLQETSGPLRGSKADTATIQSTLLLKNQRTCSGGQPVVVRCFAWNGTTWLECQNYYF